MERNALNFQHRNILVIFPFTWKRERDVQRSLEHLNFKWTSNEPASFVFFFQPEMLEICIENFHQQFFKIETEQR